jgi:hypothetical protein
MRLTMGAVILGTVLSFSGATATARATTGDQESDARLSATGTIQGVDGSARVLTLKTSRGDQRFALTERTRIQRGARSLSIADLAGWSGVRAKVRYVEADGVRRADSVMVSRDHSSRQDFSESPPDASGIANPKRSAIR